jgi:hypothetical protein
MYNDSYQGFDQSTKDFEVETNKVKEIRSPKVNLHFLGISSFFSFGRFAYSYLLIVFVVVGILSFTSCRVRLIPNRDEAMISQALQVAKSIDLFYLNLIDADSSVLAYANFSDSYQSIELELRSLWLQSEAKPLNSEVARISRIILDLWVKYKEQHQKNNTYNLHLAPIHRDRFHELFVAFLNAEKAKTIQ